MVALPKDSIYRNPAELTPWPELVPDIPPLTDEEYERLKESLKEDGQQLPVIIDEAGRILDGHHRVKALAELGQRVFVEERRGLSLDAKRDLAERLNTARRQMPNEVIAKLAASRRERVAAAKAAGDSIRKIQKQEGISKAQVQRDLKKAGVPPGTPEKVTGLDGKQYPATKPTPPPTAETKPTPPPAPAPMPKPAPPPRHVEEEQPLDMVACLDALEEILGQALIILEAMREADDPRDRAISGFLNRAAVHTIKAFLSHVQKLNTREVKMADIRRMIDDANSELDLRTVTTRITELKVMDDAMDAELRELVDLMLARKKHITQEVEA